MDICPERMDAVRPRPPRVETAVEFWSGMGVETAAVFWSGMETAAVDSCPEGLGTVEEAAMLSLVDICPEGMHAAGLTVGGPYNQVLVLRELCGN